MSDERDPEGLVSSTSDGQGIEIVRIFRAPREHVFRAWTEPESFASWFGEHGSSVPVDRASMDVRPGGTWRAVMLVGPEGSELVFSGTYREVDEPERLVLTLADQDHPDGPDVDVLTIVLDDLGDGRTRMTFAQKGGHLASDEYERAMRGWLVFFERLDEHLKTRHDGD